MIADGLGNVLPGSAGQCDCGNVQAHCASAIRIVGFTAPPHTHPDIEPALGGHSPRPIGQLGSQRMHRCAVDDRPTGNDRALYYVDEFLQRRFALAQAQRCPDYLERDSPASPREQLSNGARDSARQVLHGLYAGLPRRGRYWR